MDLLSYDGRLSKNPLAPGDYEASNRLRAKVLMRARHRRKGRPKHARVCSVATPGLRGNFCD